MRFEVLGPLVFWSLMFAVGAAIKFSAFRDARALLDLSPEAALWATGILFSLSVSEQTYFRARLVPRYTRHTTRPGFSVDYDVTLPEELGFNPKFIYLFLVSMAVWVFCLLLAGYGAVDASQLNALRISSVAFSYLLSATVVGVALRSLYEVTQ